MKERMERLFNEVWEGWFVLNWSDGESRSEALLYVPWKDTE